ncbi:MAG: DNA repair protein RecO [Bacilli bacterium]|nr:DNA repair protein RecO [Bacilli bacterium]
MKIESFEGIVLGEINYKDSSKILNVLTEKYGIVGILSKGCRNIKSKLRGVSRKLLYGTFHVYYRPNGLSTLIAVDVIQSFPKTLMDLERISYASFLMDLIQQATREMQESEIFFLLRDTLMKIEEGLPPLALTNILQVKLLDYLGVAPSIDACSCCGSNKQIVTLSSDAGGYICKDCYQNEPLVSDKTIKMIRMYYYVDIPSITKLEVSSETSKEIDTFLDDYYNRFTGLYVKSKDFLKKIPTSLKK